MYNIINDIKLYNKINVSIVCSMYGKNKPTKSFCNYTNNSMSVLTIYYWANPNTVMSHDNVPTFIPK